MSLPKEPRQLMINLMYLVLTAILALNVSAEVLNAFISMDEGINESNSIVKRSNESIYTSIQNQAEAYPQYKKYEEIAGRVKDYVEDFYNYVEVIKMNLVSETGGLDEENIPVGKKDKDFPTRYFVENGLGKELHDSVLMTRSNLLALIEDEEEEDVKGIAENLPLRIKAIPESSDKKDWSDFTFRQMPVAAALPLLSKFQSDARISETSILNYLANKISAKPAHDDYKALISADKSYVISGETLNAEIFLGAYSTTTNNISVKVNGQSVPVRNGKAMYSKSTSQLGDHIMDVEITARDPLNGTVKKYRKKYNYQVGQRSVTTSADKMNVFYVGVDNPLSVSAAGVSSEAVNVSAEGARISKVSNGKYSVKPTIPGKAKIVVTGGGLSPTTFEYRVKRIPTPIAKLGERISGKMTPGEMRIYKKITPVLENFDFNASCEILGFELVRIKKNGDGGKSINNSGNFNAKSLRFVGEAKRGDQYYFEKIKAKCPGDTHGRKLNSMAFRIR